MDIFTCNDRTPYVYIIKWSKTNKFYLGRKTAKGCHPDTFWKSYFTSSDKVNQYRYENGEPDIIRIVKIFDSIKKCKAYESRFLTLVKASSNVNFLNCTNGDENFDRTGMVAVKDNSGNNISISIDDERYTSGQLVGICNNKIPVIDKQGKTFQITKDDPRWLSKEVEHVAKRANKNMLTAKDKQGNNIRVNKNDTRLLTGELIHIAVGVSVGQITVLGEDGICFNVDKNDPRWLSGQLKSPHKGIKKSGIHFCEKCNKTFRGNSAWSKHIKSKSHLEYTSAKKSSNILNSFLLT